MIDLDEIQAVIYDMDGVLIDSEPLWHLAEKAVFAKVGVEMTTAMCLETTGLRIDEVVAFRYARDPWPQYEKGIIENELIDNVIDLIAAQGNAKSGVRESIDRFRGSGVKIALASSSPYRIIDAALDRLGIRGEFELIYSAQDEPYGKPHPGVYITTAQKLGIAPTRCLAIEDSLNGVIAAKAAQMKCIAIPENELLNDPRFSIADLVLSSLSEIKCSSDREQKTSGA